MKRILLCLLSILFAVGVLAGCGDGAAAKISDYISFAPDTVYRYEGAGDDRATQVIYNDYVHEAAGLYQRRISAGEKLVGECIRIADGAMVNYFGADNFYFFYDMTGIETNGETLVLKEPLTKGATWERSKREIPLDTGKTETVSVVAEITGENVDVTVPYGTFKALELTVTTQKTQETIKEYYVKGIGLVKTEHHARIVHSNNQDGSYVRDEYVDISSSLAAIEQNMDYTENGYFFYPDTTANEVVYENRDVRHRTNEDPAAMLEQELKNYPMLADRSLIGPDTKVNAVALEYHQSKVKADFSAALETAFTKDPAAEELLIQALVNTVGYYFNVSQVCITVDGAGYQGNITMGADEYRTVESSVNVGDTDDTGGAGQL